MHIAINGWFWNNPGVGSGQYVRRMVATFAEITPRLRINLIVPEDHTVESPGESVTVTHVPMKGRGHIAKVQFEQNIFPRAAAELGADLAHVPYWGSPLRCSIPMVVTVHDIIPLILPEYRGGLLARFYTGLVAAAARGASAVITDSLASKADIIAHLGIPESTIHAIPLAAGKRYHPREGGLVDMAVRKKYDLPEEFVLYVGGYDIRKNVHTLLKAYTYIRDGAGDMFPLVLAGKIPEKKSKRFTDVVGLAEKMNVRDVIHFPGWIDDEDMPALYRLARVFAFPSRYEGFGLDVVEALSCGTPVVATDTSSIPEIVGDAGFLVAPDDARHMAGSILAMLNQEDLHRTMSRKALEQAKQFSWARTIAETLAVYEQVLGTG